eukprot:m.20786 g.20786  ORF g.20786 m.20786 type:complete len:115 (-) comp11053_c0_seq3:430-774(-)
MVDVVVVTVVVIVETLIDVVASTSLILFHRLLTHPPFALRPCLSLSSLRIVYTSHHLPIASFEEPSPPSLASPSGPIHLASCCPVASDRYGDRYGDRYDDRDSCAWVLCLGSGC